MLCDHVVGLPPCVSMSRLLLPLLATASAWQESRKLLSIKLSHVAVFCWALRWLLPGCAVCCCGQVMDETAVTLCKENDIKIVIFDAMVPGNIMRAAMGEDVGTLVSHTC